MLEFKIRDRALNVSNVAQTHMSLPFKEYTINKVNYSSK